MEPELELNLSDDINPHETRDRLAKLLLGTAAGFIAGRMAENLYEKLVVDRRLNRL